MRRQEDTREWSEIPGLGSCLHYGRWTSGLRYWLVMRYADHEFYIIDRDGLRAPRLVKPHRYLPVTQGRFAHLYDDFSSQADWAGECCRIANDTEAAFEIFFTFRPGARVRYVTPRMTGDHGQEGVVDPSIEDDPVWMPPHLSVGVRWDDGGVYGRFAMTELEVIA